MATDSAWSKADVRNLLYDMRTAGWRHVYEWVEPGRDSIGAPDGEGYWVHRWRRGVEQIETWIIDCGEIESYINYDADVAEGMDFNSIAVGRHWLERHGPVGLRGLAATLDIIAVGAVTS